MNDPLKASILDRIKAQAGGGGMTVIMMGGEGREDEQKKKLDQELKEEGKPPTIKQKIDDSKEGKEALPQENPEGMGDEASEDFEDQDLMDDLMSAHDQDLAERDVKHEMPAKGLFGKMKHGLIGKKLAKDDV